MSSAFLFIFILYVKLGTIDVSKMNLLIDIVRHSMSIDRQHCWLIVVGVKFLTDNVALSVRGLWGSCILLPNFVLFYFDIF
jgi:hypothetical protein